MLTIKVLGAELFNEKDETFSYPEAFELKLEHSLVALSKWESIYEKPFLGNDEKTNEEVLGYIYTMIVFPEVPPEIINRLSEENIKDINDYIDAKMTATWFNEVQPSARSSETITSELIYYWMTMFNIPMACETWHLNRLFTLIKICNLKNAKPKKMSRADLAARNRELNARRKAKLGTTG